MPKKKLPAVITTFCLCFIFWLFLTWNFTAQELITGVVVSLAVALFTYDFFIHEDALWLLKPVKLGALFAYIGIFLTELVKANVDVAKRCFGGCKDINPGIVKVPVNLKVDYAQAMLADSITLTPGTITMDIAEQEGQTYYYIHWIDVTAPSGKEAGDAIKGTLEKGLRRVWE